jgi:hypothetical protein
MVWSIRQQCDGTTLYRGTFNRNSLENELPLHLEDKPLSTRRRISLQYDGAPPHFGRAETALFFNEGYEEKWIGRGRPVAWVSRLKHIVFLVVGLHEVESVSRW